MHGANSVRGEVGEWSRETGLGEGDIGGHETTLGEVAEVAGTVWNKVWTKQGVPWGTTDVKLFPVKIAPWGLGWPSCWLVDSMTRTLRHYACEAKQSWPWRRLRKWKPSDPLVPWSRWTVMVYPCAIASQPRVWSKSGSLAVLRRALAGLGCILASHQFGEHLGTSKFNIVQPNPVWKDGGAVVFQHKYIM